MKDTPPEKAAAQRAAQKDLNLEAEDERWGFDAARERRERARGADASRTSTPTAPTPLPTRGTEPRQTVAPGAPGAAPAPSH